MKREEKPHKESGEGRREVFRPECEGEQKYTLRELNKRSSECLESRSYNIKDKQER